MKTIQLKIHGRVQGVFFRVNTKKFANKIGIKGIIENQQDGTVKIIAQCSKNQLNSLKKWIKLNPGASKVEKIEEKIQNKKDIYSEFKVLRESSFLKDQKKALINLKKSLF